MRNSKQNVPSASARRMNKKTVALVLAFTLLLGTAIGGVMAYLMDKTEPVVNTFTYGNIDIELNETEGGDNHEFKMMPGITIDKDPIVTVKKGSEDNWLYVKLDKSENFDAFMTYKMAEGWTQLDGYDNIWYCAVNASDVKEDDAVYQVLKNDQVQVKTTVTKEMFDALENENSLPTLTITAYAVQRDDGQSALSTAEKAWLAIPKEASDAEDIAAALNIANENQSSANITLADDISGITGVRTQPGTTLTIDLNEHALSVGTAVGSSGTETNGMQLLKGSEVLLKNGTYKAGDPSVKLLIQNYSNLTLENVTLDGTAGGNVGYVLSCNYGNTLITGDTNIKAGSDKVALDVMHWVNDSYEDGVTVTIDEYMTGTVDGKICVYKYEDQKEDYDNCPLAKLIIKGGTYKNTGLTLEQFKVFVANGYEAKETEPGVYEVGKAN